MTARSRRAAAQAYACADCNADTAAIGEYYMVKDPVWHSARMARDGGMLCIGCLEARLGRLLSRRDFPADLPINRTAPQSARLLNRIARPRRRVGGGA